MLIEAVIKGYEEAILLLLHQGADIKTKGQYDDTVLIVAAKERYEAVVLLLLPLLQPVRVVHLSYYLWATTAVLAKHLCF